MVNKEIKWLLRALIKLAQRNLADANATEEVQAGAWPAGQRWKDLASSSQHIFMRMATKEAGIPHEEYRKLINDELMDNDQEGELDAIWQELEN